MSAIAVYHGTHRSFLEHIRANGLVPPPGHGKGVRIRLSVSEAMEDARAWSAFMCYRDGLTPAGMVIVSAVPEEWIKDDEGTLRVQGGLAADKIAIHGPHDFTAEFLHPEKGPLPAFFKALDRWEQLTGKRTLGTVFSSG